jgi:hypothetical protein
MLILKVARRTRQLAEMCLRCTASLSPKTEYDVGTWSGLPLGLSGLLDHWDCDHTH